MATKPSSNPPPATLDEVGVAKWAELEGRLAARSRTPMGLGKLEIYCAAYSRWVAAQAWLAEHGDVMEITSDKGVVIKAQPAPKLDVAARAEKAMLEASKSLLFT
jgi:phage terminase small subunit